MFLQIMVSIANMERIDIGFLDVCIIFRAISYKLNNKSFNY